eukprot:TRINITY_DN1976_c0_g1_i2.p1 TRINITY_DN1976_c0_g1~~TRINITY_DN1976_c0_g1_i2.p1  ORF type:complete len:274 (-),score=40.53 TRINITY_DN1976_c0_g1_i2:297-1118(-)
MAARDINPLIEDQLRSAVAALLKWRQNRPQLQEQALQLLESEEVFYLAVTLKKIPTRKSKKPLRINIPHSLHPVGGGSEICLIVKDEKSSESGDSYGHRRAKQWLKADGEMSGVTKVMSLSKLRSKYFAHEAKRKLCGSYHLFLADERVMPLLPRLIGKTFFKQKKHPIPVRLTSKDWTARIRRACDSTYFYFFGGSSSTVKAARVTQPIEEVMDNVMAIAHCLASKLPKKWSSVKSVYLKLHQSPSLPLFSALPEQPLKIAHQKQQKAKQQQ